MESIEDTQGFSGKTPITPSRGFSVKILTGVTPSWKTELNRSISTMEDRIPGWLQHCYEMCCEKGSCHGRWACMIWRCFHHRDVISGWVDLHMTVFPLKTEPLKFYWVYPKTSWWYLGQQYINGKESFFTLVSVLLYLPPPPPTFHKTMPKSSKSSKGTRSSSSS